MYIRREFTKNKVSQAQHVFQVPVALTSIIEIKNLKILSNCRVHILCMSDWSQS